MNDDLTLLCDAARHAGEIAMRHLGNTPKVWEKPDHQGPVSEADIEIDEMLHARLMAARPDYGWLSEETADSKARLSKRQVFVVDPIDGTRAFLGGDKAFAHAIAVVEDGRPVAGVVFMPALDRCYAAALGCGATLNDEPIKVSTRATLEGAEILAAKPALDPQHWAKPLPDINRASRPSLAYRLCLVAQGRFDGMVTIRGSWHWDVAAGALIASESGALVTDRDGHTPDFNSAPPLSAGVIAAPPTLHAQLMAHRTR